MTGFITRRCKRRWITFSSITTSPWEYPYTRQPFPGLRPRADAQNPPRCGNRRVERGQHDEIDVAPRRLLTRARTAPGAGGNGFPRIQEPACQHRRDSHGAGAPRHQERQPRRPQNGAATRPRPHRRHPHARSEHRRIPRFQEQAEAVSLRLLFCSTPLFAFPTLVWSYSKIRRVSCGSSPSAW
jgi:hypothetical protein